MNEYDHIVQLGDWFDSFHNDWDKLNQVDNFCEAVEYKKKYPKKIHLLLGNHDLNNYVMMDICSGHQKRYENEIKSAIEKCMDYVDIGVKLDSYVFSHAGFSKIWMEYNNLTTLEEVNALLHNGNYKPFHFNGIDPYGDDMSQGPLWIRPSSLVYKNMYFDKQIVGHTEITDRPVGYKDENQELIIVDGRTHDITYEVGNKYNVEFKWPLFKRCDNVKFKDGDNVYNGVIEKVDVNGAHKCNETSYDIMVKDKFFINVPQSTVFV